MTEDLVSRPRPRTWYPRTRTWVRGQRQLFVLEAPPGREQVLEDTSLVVTWQCTWLESNRGPSAHQFDTLPLHHLGTRGVCGYAYIHGYSRKKYGNE